MFAIRMKELREAAGYRSQQAFADAFGVAQSTIGGWEAGKREPNYETTIRLADFFHVSIDYLLGRELAPAPKDDGLTDPERALIAAYRAASPDDRAIIDNIVRRYTHAAEATRLA